MRTFPSRIFPSLFVTASLLFLGQAESKATITVNPSNAGNVFYTTQTVSIPMTASVGTSVDWSVIDYYGDIVATGTAGVFGGSATLLPTTNGEIGFFSLALSEMTGLMVDSTNSTQFTIIKTPPAQTNSPYGAQTHFAADTPVPPPTAIAPLLAEAGITQIRDEQYWENVENPKGTFTWPSTYTNYMSAASTNGLTPLITLDWANQFYDYSGGQFTGPTSPTGLAGFGNYSLQLLNKWNSQVSNVEVWDEYNGSFLSGTATTNRPLYYYDLLQSVSNAVKLTYPNVKIVGMATFPIADGFIKSVLTEGGTTGNSYIDIFSVHPYRGEPEGVDLEFGDLTNLIKGYNGGVAKPIWATEFSLGGTTPEEYFEEPSYLVRMISEMQSAGVAKMFYYTVQDDSDTPYRGLVGAANSSRGNYLANPVYSAYANTINQLYGWTAAGRITSGMAQTTYIYQFQKSGTNNKYVCWGGSGFDDAPTTLTMTIPTSTATLTDIMGNASMLTAVSGKVTVKVPGVDPVFVAITSGSASAITEAANPVLADSVAGYSGTEGYVGWSYGTISGTTYNQASFTNLPWQIWGSDEYRWNPAGSYPFMTIDQVQPWSNEFTVRRWTSSISGTATISGAITGPGNINSTGVYCDIYVGGTAVYTSPLITPNQVVDYNLPNIPLGVGTVVDFVENTNGSPNYDATGWITRITQGNTPTNVSVVPGNTMDMLNWTAPPGAVKYDIKRSTVNGGPYTSVNSTDTTTGYADTALSNGTTYYYVVASINGAGVESAASPQVSVTPVNSPPPSPWVGTDIGGPFTPASIDNLAGSVFLEQSKGGSGPGTTNDSFHFLSQPVTGKCTITAKVVAQYTNTYDWDGSGIMIRETTNTNSSFMMNYLSLSHGAIQYYRNADGGNLSSRTAVTAVQPYWLRLQRSSNTFTAYTSPDGSTWTQLGSAQTFTMSSTAQVGLILFGLGGEFTNVTITQP